LDNEEYFDYLSDFYKRNPEYTYTLPDILKGRNIEGKGLDIGCGMGHLISLLQDKQWIVGIDINHKLLKYGREHLQARNILTASATKLPFRDESFDWIIANQVIEHISNYHSFLDEALRVLKAGGRIFISTPNRLRYIRPWRPKWTIYGLLGKIKEDPTHVHEFTYRELKNIIEFRFAIKEIRCSGEILSTTRFASSLENWPWFLRKLLAANFDVSAEKGNKSK